MMVNQRSFSASELIILCEAKKKRKYCENNHERVDLTLELMT